MLAIKRIAKVKGRIRSLIDSINTISGMRATGVPRGTRCANHNIGLNRQEKITGPNHKPKENLNPTVIKAVGVITKGVKPVKLAHAIKTNTPTNIFLERESTPTTKKESRLALNRRIKLNNETLSPGLVAKPLRLEIRQIPNSGGSRLENKVSPDGSKIENRLITKAS